MPYTPAEQASLDKMSSSYEREHWHNASKHERYSRVVDRNEYRNRITEIFGEKDVSKARTFHKVYLTDAERSELERRKRIQQQLEANEATN